MRDTTMLNVSDGKSRILLALVIAAMVSPVVAALRLSPHIIAYGQTPAAPSRSLAANFVAEEGSPIVVTAARSEFELDPFGAPRAAKVFISYKNISDRPVAAVKFRVRNTDDTGKDRGTYHAPHVMVVPPGGSATEKWRHEKVDPRTTRTLVRVLLVKYADGSTWQSAKMEGIATPTSSPFEGASSQPAAAAEDGGSLEAQPSAPADKPIPEPPGVPFPNRMSKEKPFPESGGGGAQAPAAGDAPAGAAGSADQFGEGAQP